MLDFILRTLPYSLEDVIRATLQAFEAQLYLYACKHTCRLLKRAATEQLSDEEFTKRDYLDGVEIAVRARATVRRAGLLWALAEHPNPPPGGRDYNAYAGRIDALLASTQEFTSIMSQLLTKHARILFDALDGKPAAAREAWFDALLMQVEQDSNLRLDLFYILVAFGCPGGVDVLAYLRGMRSATQQQVAAEGSQSRC